MVFSQREGVLHPCRQQTTIIVRDKTRGMAVSLTGGVVDRPKNYELRAHKVTERIEGSYCTLLDLAVRCYSIVVPRVYDVLVVSGEHWTW